MFTNDFGEVKSASIIKWFSNDKNLKLILDLKEIGISFKYKEENVDEDNKFFEKNILITGKSDKYNREQIIDFFIKKGSRIFKQYSKNIDFFIVGDKPSKNKLKDAPKEKIISINEIL